MKSFNDIWETIHQKENWGKYPAEDIIRFMARNYYNTDRSSIRVLDLGCGGGSNTWYLSKEGFDTYAIDGAPTAVAKTKKYLDELNLQATLKVGDVAHLDYDSKFFDVIIEAGVITANVTEGIKLILSQCYRVLKHGGKMLSSVLFNTETTGYGKGEKIEEGTYTSITEGVLTNRGTAHFFTKDEVEMLFQSVGFKIVSIDTSSRTEYNGLNKISYFIVNAEK